jgi:hypothetical protein
MSTSPETRFKSNIERLSRVQALPYFVNNDIPDFRFFTLGVLTRFAQAVEHYESRGGKAPRFVIAVPGLPGNGKSYLIEGINETIDLWGGPALRQRLGADLEGWFAHRNWEHNGLYAARAEGLITTDTNLPANMTGLIGANLLLQDSLVETVRTHLFTTVEAPVVGAVLKNSNETDLGKKWRGRLMGNEALRNLYLAQGPFEQVAEEFDLQSFAAGVCGGPTLEIFNDYRGELKSAKTLQQARLRVRKYGKTPPANENEFLAMKEDGASPEQMRVINRVVWSLMQELEREGGIMMMSTEDFMPQYTEKVKDKIGMSRPFSAFIRYSTGMLLRYIFQEDFELGPERFCIGYNDPTFEELGINKARQAVLKKYYTRLQMTSPAEDLIF